MTEEELEDHKLTLTASFSSWSEAKKVEVSEIDETIKQINSSAALDKAITLLIRWSNMATLPLKLKELLQGMALQFPHLQKLIMELMTFSLANQVSMAHPGR